MFKQASWAVSFLVLPLLVTSQELPPQLARADKSVCLPATSNAPEIDGVLHDTEWGSAARIDDLHQFQPNDHGIPSERSEFFVTYDQDYFYVGARLYDSEPNAINARQLVQGAAMVFDDSIEFLLDSFDTRRTAYWFQVNANGVRHDGLYESPVAVNPDWDGLWLAEARVDEAGWMAEVAIPFKTITFDPANPNWGFTIARTIARKDERIAWSSFDRQINPGSAGHVGCIEDIRQGIGLDVVPSFIVNQTENSTNGKSDNEFEPSLDIYYNLTPSLTGILTLNTDFSATEVDDRQVNLTRFSIFLPEKRQFFNQDVDIFKFANIRRNGIPFFSRRIGLGASGEPIDLVGGLKLTGRVGRWNIGVLNVLQDEFGDVDESNLFVARVSANILEESSIGMIATHGNPSSELDNHLVGVDFRYRSRTIVPGRTVQGSAWFQQSSSEGVSADQNAYGVDIFYPNREGWYAGLSAATLEENFNPALGFANRTGTRDYRGELAYTFRPAGGLLRSIRPAVISRYTTDISGRTLTRFLALKPVDIESRRGDKMEFRFRRHEENLDREFEISDGVFIPPGEYTYDLLQLIVETARSRQFGLTVNIEKGDFFDGEHLGINGSIDWRPNPHVYWDVGYVYNDVDLPGGSFQTRIIRTRFDIAFNSKWSWLNSIQYDNVSDTAGLNSRLRYNRQAGQDLYIVYNSLYDVDEMNHDFATISSEAVIKFTYVFRF